MHCSSFFTTNQDKVSRDRTEQKIGGEAEEAATMTSNRALVVTAKSKSLVYTSPASPNIFASPIHTLASVPFCWEEKPGKPKHHSSHPPHSYKCLELPPRLLLPSEFTKMPLPASGDHRFGAPVAAGRKGVWGFWKKKGKGGDGGRGSYVFPSNVYTNRESERGEDGGAINTNSKITMIKDTSLSIRRSLFWANIYKGFKQVVQRKSRKLRRDGF